MNNDKLKDLTPVDVLFNEGERPTDEKLQGMMEQVSNGLKDLENLSGDAWGESLQLENNWINNFTRDIGDRSKLDPVLMPDIEIDNYVQDLSLGSQQHVLDLIPIGVGASLVSSSADVSVVPGQYKSTVKELTSPGDWTILPGLNEGGVEKNSRMLVTHSPSDGNTITLTKATSGRGSTFSNGTNNLIPGIAQAREGGPFLSVSLSDTVLNIYTIVLPVNEYSLDRLYQNSVTTISNTKPGIGTGHQHKLPTFFFDTSGLDLEADDPSTGQGKIFPLNLIRIYDWDGKKIIKGLKQVQASFNPSARRYEILCQFESDILLDEVTGRYILVADGASISDTIGGIQRDLFFHTHSGDDMVPSISHNNLFGLRTGTIDISDRSKYYGPSIIDNNDHSMYFHRDGFTDSDIGGGANVIRGHVVIGSETTGPSGHENYNLGTDSNSLYFGHLIDSPRLFFDKVFNQSLSEGRGNIPQVFSDNALVIRGSVDDTTSLIKTTAVDGNLRATGDVVLGTDHTHDVFIPGDAYIKNSLILVPRNTSGLSPEEGMIIYSSGEKGLTYWNGSSWVDGRPFAAVVGDGTISFGKYNGPDPVTLQSAIDAAAVAGGTVKILKGNYDTGATAVTIPSNISIEGEGSAANITGTATIFEFQAGSEYSNVKNLTLDTPATAIRIKGEGHSVDDIVIKNAAKGISLDATAIGTKIGERIRYIDVAARLFTEAYEGSNTSSSVQSTGFATRPYLIDSANKGISVGNFIKLAGAGTLTYEDSTDAVEGVGRFKIEGDGIWEFNEFIPVDPEVGLTGKIASKTNGTTARITAGFNGYDSGKILLSDLDGFIVENFVLDTSWSRFHSAAITEAASGKNSFRPGTVFVKPRIQVSLNSTSIVYFDGFNISVPQEGKMLYNIGEVRSSILGETIFQSVHGSGWVLMDGRDITGSDLHGLTGMTDAPDGRGMFMRGKNNGRSDGQENPEGELSLGVHQVDQVGPHNHKVSNGRADTGFTGNSNLPFLSGGSGPWYSQNNVSDETRPKNITINWFMKINFDVA